MEIKFKEVGNEYSDVSIESNKELKGLKVKTYLSLGEIKTIVDKALEEQDMIVKFTPLGKEKVHLEAEGFVDPGGIAPTWAMNFVRRNAPYSTMLGLQRRVNMTATTAQTEPSPFIYSE